MKCQAVCFIYVNMLLLKIKFIMLNLVYSLNLCVSLNWLNLPLLVNFGMVNC